MGRGHFSYLHLPDDFSGTGIKKGSVRPGLTFRPIIFLRSHDDRPLAGSESGKGAMRSRSDRLLAGALPFQAELSAISPFPRRAPMP